MEFSRQECWSGLPFPSPGDLPNPGIEPGSPMLQADSLSSEPPENLNNYYFEVKESESEIIQPCQTFCDPHDSLVALTVESACNVGDASSVPGLGRSPGGRNENPLQYSCLGNPMDGGSWETTVHEVAGAPLYATEFNPI